MNYKKLIMKILDKIDDPDILKQIYILILHFVP